MTTIFPGKTQPCEFYKMKILIQLYLLLVVAGFLTACTTPDEKAASYIKTAQELLYAGNLNKAEVAFKSALHINPNLVDAEYGLVLVSEKKKEWRKNYSLLNEIYNRYPDHLESRVKLIPILLGSNQLEQAELIAKEIQALDPNDSRGYILLAAVFLRQEKFDEAMSEANKASRNDFSNSDSFLIKAQILMAQDKFNEALSILDSGIKTDPANKSLYLIKIRLLIATNNIVATEKTYLALIERFTSDISIRQEFANYYISIKQSDNAEQVLSRIVIDFPESVDDKLKLVVFKNQYRSTDESLALLMGLIQENKTEHRFRFALAKLYESTGEVAKAKEVYQEVIEYDKIQSNGLEARNRLALIEVSQGRRSDAENLVEEVLKNDKNNEHALLIRSGLQLADGEFEEAIVRLRKILRNNPESVRALSLLGKVYEAQGNHRQTTKSYAGAYNISPTLPVIANQYANYLVRQGKPESADTVLLNSISLGNRSLATVELLTQIKLLLQEWDMAEQLAKQIYEINGKEALSQQLLGLVYQGRQQREASINAFKRAYELSPSSSQPIMSLVKAHIQSGNSIEARKFLESVVSDHSDNVKAYLLLGGLDLAEKNPAEAERHFLKAIEVNPKLTFGYRELANVYLMTNDFDKAKKILIRGLTEIPNNNIFSLTLASVFVQNQQFDEAIAIYESLLKKSPKLVVAKNNLANILIDYKSDDASLKKAFEISREFKNSEVPQLQDTHAWAAIKAGGDIDAAISTLKRILRKDEKTPEYNYHLGEAYFKKGGTTQATHYLKQAVKYGESDSLIIALAKARLQEMSQ